MKKNFTLVEIVTVCVVILIISSMGLVTYRQVLDNARQQACSVQETTYTTGIKIACVENGGVCPASMSEYKPEHFQKAYARVQKNLRWPAKLSLLFLKAVNQKEAFAYPDPTQYKCPADNTSEGISYCISTKILGKRWQDEIDDGSLLVFECDVPNGWFDTDDSTLSTILSPRHTINFGTQKVTNAAYKDLGVYIATPEQHIETQTECNSYIGKERGQCVADKLSKKSAKTVKSKRDKSEINSMKNDKNKK